STILLPGGGFDIIQTYYERAAVLRNNYVNGQIFHGPLAYLSGISVAGILVTLTTKTPHGYTLPGDVSVAGIRVNGSLTNELNGVFKIEQILSDTQLTYKTYAS